MNLILDPLQYQFFQHGLLAALMVGVVWVSLMWMYFTEVRPLNVAKPSQQPESSRLI